MRLKIRIPGEKLSGTSAVFSIEARIFNTIALFLVVVLCVNAVVNYILGLLWLGILMLVAAMLLAGMYYISRIRQKLWLAVLLFGVLGNTLLAVNYFYNSGFNGPSLYIFLLMLFLITAVSPKKQYLFWLIINPIIVCALLYVDYRSPGLIVYSYVNKFDNYADIGYSYVIIAAVTCMVTMFLKNTYYEQKQLLENKAKELRNANQTKEKLLSIIAHDLRSPLASIQNYLEILNEFDLSEEEKKSMEQQLLLKTKNTEQMVSNLLYWTMNQMNGVKPKLTTLNLKEVIAPVLLVIRASTADKGIEIDDQLPGNVMLNADSDMLQIIVRNLVSNAVKFTLPGGSVTISCKAEGLECKIMVRDNGVGIPKERQSGIFSLTADSTYGTGQEKGTGLGLILCKEFAELQNGSIGFESEINVGTTFYFKLKFAAGAPEMENTDRKELQKSAFIRSV